MANVVSCLMPGATWDRATQGVIGKGDSLAASLGGQHLIVCGQADLDAVRSSAQYADRIFVVQDAEYAQYHPESALAVLHAACERLDPTVVLLSQDTYSQETAPRLGFRLGGCSIGDAQQIDVVDGQVIVTRSVYGGKAMAKVRANTIPAVLWIRARAFPLSRPREHEASIESHNVLNEQNRPPTLGRTEVNQRTSESSGEARLEDARVIVSGGRGLGGPEPFKVLGELAAVMGAQQAASRAACDAGWVPASWQVGQTGKKVAPELYLAIGISGASQHLMGIADAKTVAAINTDPDAPIFRRADFGIVEDWKNVVGPLIEALRQSEQGQS